MCCARDGSGERRDVRIDHSSNYAPTLADLASLATLNKRRRESKIRSWLKRAVGWGWPGGVNGGAESGGGLSTAEVGGGEVFRWQGRRR